MMGSGTVSPRTERRDGAGRCARHLALILLALVLLPLSPSLADPGMSLDGRVEALLARMTLEEKIGQLTLVSNQPPFDPAAYAPDIVAGRLGGLLNFKSPGDVAILQAAARRSRLGIPLLFGADILHGYRTVFPMPLGEAASFDPPLARFASEMAAREASEAGLNWTFAPDADLSRDPRWGRMVEGSGEDPYLGRVFTRARVEGFRAGGLATTLKHFAGYGAPIGGRDYDASAIAPADLHDSFLPPFRAGIEAGSESVMSGLNSVNGVPSTVNEALLTGILREKWGFRGFVVSDWAAVLELQQHGVAADGAEAARKALLAGVDMDMESRLYERHLPEEVRSGRVPLRIVDEAVRRVLRAKFGMGLFERPDIDPTTRSPEILSETMRQAARAVARDTMVLLRNEGALLPLAGPKRIALVGGMAGQGRDLTGPHAAKVRFEDAPPIVDALRARAERDGATVSFAPGCEAECLSDEGFDAALEAARQADIVVAVLGEPYEGIGEAASRASLRLVGRQSDLLQRLVETGKPVILVLLATRPVELGPVVDRLAGLLMAWFPGTEGGAALADILFGDHAPSARLPVTWPRSVGQVPLTYDGVPSGRPHDPGNRFTLRYVDEDLAPLFPFGFGLSYGTVAYSDLQVVTPRVSRAGTLDISVQLGNTGRQAVREVAQLYVRQIVSSRSRPRRQLKAFRKVALQPGQSETVTFRVPAAEFGFHRDDGSYVVEAGRYTVFVGASSDAELGTGFEVVE